MNQPLLVSLVLGSAGLAAQAPQKPVPPIVPVMAVKAPPAGDAPALPLPDRNTFLPGSDVASSTALDAARAPALPTVLARQGVLFDQLGDVHWALSGSWKASFDARGATFVPFLGSQAPRNFPTRFDLASTAIGGDVTPARDATVVREGNTLVLERGNVREEYVASEAGIEQRFVFRELSHRGAITIDLDVQTEFAVAATANGHTFTHELGAFAYGLATAIDAKGASVPVPVTRQGGHLRLAVPAGFVEQAQLPLVVDPLVSSLSSWNWSSPLTTDIAYDATLHQFAVCYTLQWSATDVDCVLSLADDDMGYVAPAVSIDASFTSWAKARIANLNAYDRFLVVAECGASPTRHIGMRTFTPVGNVMGPQLDLTGSSTDHLAPDVGGDPSLVVPTYFAVTYEAEFLAADHDVNFVMVREDGSVFLAAQTIDNSIAMEHSPRIGKSNGQPSQSNQEWVVAYRRDIGTDTQTRMAAITWNGQARLFGGVAYNAPVAAAAPSSGIGGLAVSSPTAANIGQRYLIVDTLLDPAQGNRRRLRGSAVDRFGGIYSTSMLSDAVVSDYEPVVDTDGGRFVVGWLDGNPGTFMVGTFDLVGASVLAHEVVQAGFAQERGASLVAMHSGGASAAFDREYGLAWNNVTNYVFEQRYRGIGTGGVGFRNTGCGPLSWSVTGLAAIGTPMQFQLTGGAGFTGWAFGNVAQAPLPQCPGCVVGTSADILLLGSWLTFAIPFDTRLVGMTFAMQGFDFGPGPCLGALWLSDTADLTVR